MLLFGSFGWRGITVFKNKSKTSEEIVEAIVWTVLEWASKKKKYKGISLESIDIRIQFYRGDGVLKL